MKIYFEEGHAVPEELLQKMTEAAEYAVESENMHNLDKKRCEINKKDHSQLLLEQLFFFFLILAPHHIKTMKGVDDHQREDHIFG